LPPTAPLSPADRVPAPLALVARHRITAANAAARARGVQPGHKRATALALVPDLHLAEAQPARDAALLQAVVHAALAFTPQVCTEGLDTVLLEVQASLRCFGGAAALQQRLQAAWCALGLQVQLGVAPTPLAAAWLARWRPVPGLVSGPAPPALLAEHVRQLPALHRLLDQAPLALLAARQPQAQATVLAALGLQRLGELRALPRAGLARRLGPAVLDELDRAYGLRPDPRPALQAAAEFETRLELQARADHSEQLLHAAALLLPRLVAWAAARQVRVAAFTLHLLHEARHRGAGTPPRTALHVELAEPSLDQRHLLSLLQERLQRLVLPAPTLDLHLHCRHTVAGAAPNGELFPNRQSHALGLGRLLERLRARLGDAQVLRPAPLADHRPEVANRLAPAQGPAAPVPAGALPVPTPGWPLQRPLWLLPEPLPLPEQADQPCWGGQPLRLLAGPERVETGWWDQAPALRDYYVAQAASGALLWVFCSRWWAAAPVVETEAPDMPQGAADLPVARGKAATRARVRGEPVWFLQGQFG
jgi:protein ImuB